MVCIFQKAPFNDLALGTLLVRITRLAGEGHKVPTNSKTSPKRVFVTLKASLNHTYIYMGFTQKSIDYNISKITLYMVVGTLYPSKRPKIYTKNQKLFR